MTPIVISALNVISVALNLYVYVIIASAILSWLLAFDIINLHNQFVAMISRAVWQLTEPPLRPIRRFLPSMGGLDLSPVVLLLIIMFIQNLIAQYSYRLMMG